MRSRQLSTGQRHGRANVTAVAAAIAAVILLGSGCSLANLNPNSKPTREIPPPPDLSTPKLRQDSLTGNWEGTYTCPQGLMRLNLTLLQRPNGMLSAVFRFAPGPSNSEARSGSFSMRGTVTGSSLVLRGDS